MLKINTYCLTSSIYVPLSSLEANQLVDILPSLKGMLGIRAREFELRWMHGRETYDISFLMLSSSCCCRSSPRCGEWKTRVGMGGPSAIGSVIILRSAPDWLHEEERFAFGVNSEGAILADLSYC
ncbi:hypothetical protein C4D60_Mb11t04600 [Musa balbisiana]|uniref:Uncharacterized protein n=1 Tax=Musa balbisiana TaxID=52838 RepID=A0A4S8J1T1_MUSBA|nr:hypothetical protein C4D60_Mb11t04600 [Musa balbisiana]